MAPLETDSENSTNTDELVKNLLKEETETLDSKRKKHKHKEHKHKEHCKKHRKKRKFFKIHLLYSLDVCCMFFSFFRMYSSNSCVSL